MSLLFREITIIVHHQYVTGLIHSIQREQQVNRSPCITTNLHETRTYAQGLFAAILYAARTTVGRFSASGRSIASEARGSDWWCIRTCVVRRGPRVRARPCCFTHASRLLRKEDPPREGERGRRARAVPERPRSFLSYPENRSLRHAALDDRHRITRVHHRPSG